MSGDLEDFLRRAAERRRAKTVEQPEQKRRRPQPEYTDSRRERITEPLEVAEIVEEPVIADLAEGLRIPLPDENRRRSSGESQQHEADPGQQHKPRQSADASASERQPLSPAQEIVQMLRHPSGVRQAILLREILERPEHRW